MDSEKIFQNQREILEYLGKNPNDRNLISRMIRKGEIEKLDGWYRLVERVSSEELEKLKAENEELKKRVASQEFEISLLQSAWVTSEDLKEATTQWKYYEQLYEEEKEDKQRRIRKCFQWIKARNPKANLEEFIDRVMSDEE